MAVQRKINGRSIGNFEDNYQARKGKLAITVGCSKCSPIKVSKITSNNNNIESADEVSELLSQEVSRLRELYKMIEFEKRNSTHVLLSKFMEEENEENLVGRI
ncbi:hypothetical protein Glove_139g250 [Diversispora epigaea]|uniref:Uncharacterized protein n=1 Tax=Diversispora epigaea TaxID=1348612 RepID=A0A397IYG0_9GLOM|nr:hypothetical protein Glove_139g250 [Diversispora epigaea]